MKHLLMILLSLSMVACATAKKEQVLDNDFVITEDDQGIDPYLALFKIEAEKRGVSIEYQYGLQIRLAENLTRRTGAEGVCLPPSDKTVVYLDKNLWENAPHLVKEQLIFHELGHCILGFGHDNTTDPQNRRLSIMHEHGVDLQSYAENREYYLDRLFGKFRQILQKQMMFFQNMKNILDAPVEEAAPPEDDGEVVIDEEVVPEELQELINNLNDTNK